MKKALVVDDSKGWVDYHCSVLKEIFADDLEIDKAYSAKDGYDFIYAYVNNPYDLIITDLHMENAYNDKYAGEWLVEQIKLLSQYFNAKIIICSAAYNIRLVAENLNVEYIHKSLAAKDSTMYKKLISNSDLA